MPAVPMRILIVNNQVKFSTALKKTLEDLGGFDIAPFSTFEAAMEYVRNRALDVAIIDTRIKDASALEFIQRLRLMQPHIALILSPDTPENQAAARKLEVQALIDTPISARRLIPVLHRARSDALDLLPDTVTGPRAAAETRQPPAKRDFSSLEQVIDSMGVVEDASATMEVDMAEVEAAIHAERERQRSTPPDAPINGYSVVDRIIEEEPPLPAVEEGGTVHDLAAELAQDTGQRVIEILKATQDIVAPTPLPIDDDSPDPELPNLARELLMQASDPDAPLEALSAAAEAADTPDAILEDAAEQEERLSQSSLIRAAPDAPMPAPELAQLALQLTQASLELTAEGMLLSDGAEVVAAAGDLPPDDIEGLRALIGGDWSAPNTQSRIRFFTLPSSGKDYMLYSRRTVGGLTLTMIFAGKTPISDIRRQANRVVEALISVPESGSAAPAASPARTKDYDGVRTPQTYIWLLSEAQKSFDDSLAKVLVAGLNVSLTRESWAIHALDVYDKYIYLHADVPGERPPFEVIAQLKQLSGQIVRMRDSNIAPETMWRDSYMVVIPGRELSAEEIERFVNFAAG